MGRARARPSTGTADPADYHWRELARDLVALADALGIGRFVAGGDSMGAATALHTAVDAPDRVVGLLLVLPPTAWETRTETEYTHAADTVEQHGVDAYVEEWNARPVPKILEPIAEIYQFTPAVPAELFPSALAAPPASDLPSPGQVQAITVPSLILAWDTDPGHPLSTAERLHELLPASELHVAHELADIGPWTEPGHHLPRPPRLSEEPPENFGTPPEGAGPGRGLAVALRRTSETPPEGAVSGRGLAVALRRTSKRRRRAPIQ